MLIIQKLEQSSTKSLWSVRSWMAKVSYLKGTKDSAAPGFTTCLRENVALFLIERVSK